MTLGERGVGLAARLRPMARYLVAPSIWLALGLLGVFMPAHLASERFLDKRTEHQRQQVRDSDSHRLQYLMNGAIGLFCLVNAIASAWTGRGFWWMWMLATMAHVGALVSRERAVNRFMVRAGERREALTQQERTRQRYVVAYATVSVLALSIGQAVLPPQDRADVEGARVVLSAVLLVVAVVTAVAAGWSAVWSFRRSGLRRPRGRRTGST